MEYSIKPKRLGERRIIHYPQKRIIGLYVLDMATSSITKNFVVSGQRQVEKFANAIEESYQESLHRAPTPDLRITHLRDTEDIREFMAKRKKTNA